jgi:hypothetical protein
MISVEGVEYDYTNMYRIYIDGRVESVKRFRVKQKFLKERTNNYGYKRVSLYKDSKVKKYLIHRLIAIHFIPNPHNFTDVDHINELKDDNRIENLRWCSHGTNLRNRTTKRTNDIPRGVCITRSGKYRVQICINYKIKLLGTYETKEEASDIYEEALRERMNNELNNIHL